jgi:hypothetical protein
VQADQRIVAMRLLAELVADRGRLTPGLTVATATDVIDTLFSIEVLLLLTADRGGSPAGWQRWMAGRLADALLA